MPEKLNLSNKDIKQIQYLGKTVKDLENQLAVFEKGPSFLDMDRPATVGDGIRKLDEGEVMDMVDAYEAAAKAKTMVKFIPASGAATRMFKNLFGWRSDRGGVMLNELREQAGAGDEEASFMLEFVENLEKFAFWPALEQSLVSSGVDVAEKLRAGDYTEVVDHLLYEDPGLGYGSLPKGLLLFHQYADRARTPFEEHLVEAADYARSPDNRCRLHFTTSPEHDARFKHLLDTVRAEYEELYKTGYEVDFSNQDHATDTIAATPDNQPFRDEDDSLFFRPGGHGALIHNLDAIDADILFINNIDNVVMDREKPERGKWKKVLAGLLVSVQSRIFHYMGTLSGADPSDAAVKEAYDFTVEYLGETRSIPGDKNKALDFLRDKMDRPLRVCGMVLNLGDPGGAPFWIREKDGGMSLQIVESAQVNSDDERQKDIFRSSTHFNPVDIACAVRDWRGEKYDLRRFVDQEAVFISEKSKNGRPLKALELPGLWNGSMAGWNTLFVDVPVVAFHPVKTVNDLLKESHQPV